MWNITCVNAGLHEFIGQDGGRGAFYVSSEQKVKKHYLGCLFRELKMVKYSPWCPVEKKRM